MRGKRGRKAKEGGIEGQIPRVENCLLYEGTWREGKEGKRGRGRILSERKVTKEKEGEQRVTGKSKGEKGTSTEVKEEGKREET